jgi:hypothetical protein
MIAIAVAKALASRIVIEDTSLVALSAGKPLRTKMDRVACAAL